MLTQAKDNKIQDLIDRNMGLIVKLSNKVSNAVMTSQDAQQELILKLLGKLDRDPQTLDKPIVQQDKITYKVLLDYHVDLIRFYSRRPDTSKYCPNFSTSGVEYGTEDDANYDMSVEDIDHTAPMFSCNEMEHPEKKVSEDLYFRELIARAKEFEESYPGITEFIKQALDPSEEVLEQYETYRKGKKYSRHPERNYIPPYTLIKFLGISESRLRRFHIVISKILSNLEISRASEIYKRLSYS